MRKNSVRKKINIIKVAVLNQEEKKIKWNWSHIAVVTVVSKVTFNQAINLGRVTGRFVAVELPSEIMDLPIVKIVSDVI